MFNSQKITKFTILFLPLAAQMLANGVKSNLSKALNMENGAEIIMHSAALVGDLELFKFAIENGADITCHTEDGTVLHTIAYASACNFYNKELLDIVLKSGVDLYAENSNGETVFILLDKILSELEGNVAELEGNVGNTSNIQKVLIDLYSELEQQANSDTNPYTPCKVEVISAEESINDTLPPHTEDEHTAPTPCTYYDRVDLNAMSSVINELNIEETSAPQE